MTERLQTKLAEVGYTGGFDVSSLIKEIEKTHDIAFELVRNTWDKKFTSQPPLSLWCVKTYPHEVTFKDSGPGGNPIFHSDTAEDTMALLYLALHGKL